MTLNIVELVSKINNTQNKTTQLISILYTNILKEIDIFVSVLIESNASAKVKNKQINDSLTVKLKLIGEHGDINVELLRTDLFNIREVYAATTNGNGYFFDFRVKIVDVGKVRTIFFSN